MTKSESTSSCRTELAIAVNELTGQALLDRLESIVQEACIVSCKQALDLDLEKLLNGNAALPYGVGEYSHYRSC